MQEWRFSKNEIQIGRSDPDEPDNSLDISLDGDLHVSKRHVRILRSERKWFIHDLDSKYGTVVDGQEIRGQGVVDLPLGAPVRTGNTIWTILPCDWLFIRRGDVILCAACVNGVNYAAYHCGVPVIGTLVVRNIGRDRSASLNVKLEIEGYSDPYDVKVPSLDPATCISLGRPVIRLHAALLRSQTDPVRAQLTVRVNGEPDPQVTQEITVLGFRAWLHHRVTMKTIAAFVSPHSPVVNQMVRQVYNDMSLTMGSNSLGELLRSGCDDAEGLFLKELYRCLKDHYIVKWLPPRSEGGYQNIRGPHHIFASNLPQIEGEATCIDLAVFMAGCIEKAGLCPVIVFTGNEDDAPCHAFVGCWAGSTPGSRPVINDRELLKREVRSGNLLVVECTGCAEGGGLGGRKLDFHEAVASAVKQLTDEKRWQWVCAVDIGAVRPPYGSITPLDRSLEPEVERAYDEAELFAKRKKSAVVETTFLFYGCLAANGEIVRWLLREAGMDAGHIRDRIDKLTKMRAFSGEPSPTRNYLDCQWLAEDLYWRAGSPSVREQDLLWSLLSRGPASGKFSKTCRELELDLGFLATILGKRYPCPEIPETLSSFASGLEE